MNCLRGILFLILCCTAARSSSIHRRESSSDSFEEEFDSKWDTETSEFKLAEDLVDSSPLESDLKMNCTQCTQSKERRALRLLGIKNQILNQLGLTQPPNVTGKQLPHVPPLNNLLDHYNMQRDAPAFVPGPEYGEEDDFHITTEKVLSFAQSPSRRIHGDEGDNVIYFKFSSTVMTSQVQSAHFWVYIRHNHHVPHRNITLYQVVRHFSHEQPEIQQVRKKAAEKRNRHGHWMVYDVKKFVAQWFRHPKENLGFVVRSSSQDPADVVDSDFENNKESLRPFIEVKVEKQRHRRSKRMIGLNCEENSNEVRCCRYPLTVDFEEFGWDWIIAPKRYEANYCSGECPYVFLQKYPHTHLVQQANPQGSAGPCCAPRKMSSISMLYFDEDFNIIYGMLPGMVVDRCGCS